VKPEFSRASESFKKANPHIFAEENVVEAPDSKPSKEQAKSEKELQDQIAGHFEIAGTVVVRSRMDKKTSVAVGIPDLLFALKGAPVAMEVKLPGEKLTKEQEKMMANMKKNGWLCHVVYSYDQAVEIGNKIILQRTLEP